MKRNFVYDTQGSNTFLVYKVAEEDTLDSVSLGMITNNRIPGLATTMFTQMDEDRFIKYNVSAKISVSQFLSGPVSKKRLLGVFLGIVEAMQSAEDYMIEASSIVLDMDYMYADVSTCETTLICRPVLTEGSAPLNLGMFFKNIMFNTPFDESEDCDYVAKIIGYLNNTPMFNIREFGALLSQIKKESAQPKSAQSKAPETKPQQRSAPAQSERRPKPSNPAVVQNNKVSDAVLDSVKQIKDIPVSKEKPAPAQSKPKAEENEKPMSMLYLLQHYNKENAEIYRAQKESKKKGEKKPEKQSKKIVSADAKKISKPAQPQKATNPMSYAIPGAAPAAPKAPDAPEAPELPKKTEPKKPAESIPKSAPSVPNKPRPAVRAAQAAAQNFDFGNTVYLFDDSTSEDTVIIDSRNMESFMPKAHLIRKKTNEDIVINKPTFRIGKEKSYADYCIEDNGAISRSHANIVTRDGEYYLVDTNSTNHSFINSMMVGSNVENKLTTGDKVRLANEEFEFRIF